MDKTTVMGFLLDAEDKCIEAHDILLLTAEGMTQAITNLDVDIDLDGNKDALSTLWAAVTEVRRMADLLDAVADRKTAPDAHDDRVEVRKVTINVLEAEETEPRKVDFNVLEPER